MVKYGGGSSDVALRLGREGDTVTLVFRDEGGRPFDMTDPRAHPRAAPSLDTERPGGRGLQLVQALADELRYQHDGRVGTTTVRKRLPV